MRVIGIQLDIAWEDKPANFKKVQSLLKPLDIAPGSLIVLPEMFATGFSMNVAGIFEEEEGMTFAFLKHLAQRYRSFAVGGLVTRAPDGRGRNEAVVADPGGTIHARYRKMHPFSLAGEHRYYEPGQDMVTFAWGGFTAAPFICYDLRFPEVFRKAMRRGADLFVVIACWPAKREAHWTALLQARAIENQAYVIGVNRCGTDPEHVYSGRSFIIDPRGAVIADAGNGEGIIQAEVDHAFVVSYRQELPFLADARLDCL